MDAEFESKLKEIGSLLGITELPDNIGDIVDSFISDTGDRNAEADGETACGGECEKSTGGLFSQLVQGDNETDDLPGIDPKMIIDMMGKLQQARANSKNDKKIKLLKALRPFLGKPRQAKVDNCVKLMMLSEVALPIKNN